MGVSGLPADHQEYARAALPSYGRDPDAPLRLLSLSENATYLVDAVSYTHLTLPTNREV